MVDGVPRRVDAIEVVFHEKKIFVAGTFNRRLCCWRLLALFRPDRFQQVKVRFRSQEEKDAPYGFKWSSKYTTECHGNWVQVRDLSIHDALYVGKKIETESGWWNNDWEADPGVQWPEAIRLLKRC